MSWNARVMQWNLLRVTLRTNFKLQQFVYSDFQTDFLIKGAKWVFFNQTQLLWQKMLFRGGEMTFGLNRRDIYQPTKLLILVRRHLFYFTRLQFPIWRAEQALSFPWPHYKWETKGAVGLAIAVDWSAALTAFRDTCLDVDHIWFSVQPYYRP